MASVNKVIIVGNLGRDPEVRYTADNKAVTTIAVATSDRYTDKNTGEKKEITEWHRIVFFNRLAEIAGEYLKKGSSVYVEGKLKTRKWTDNDGVERYTTEITADSLQMLGGRSNAGEEAHQAPASGGATKNDYAAAKNGSTPPARAPRPVDDLDGDMIPF